MSKWVVVFLAFCLCEVGFAQTNSLTSGNWSDGTVWSTGAVPATSATVNVNNPITLDQNITITTGTYNFYSNVTDYPGGTSYTLTASTAGGTLDIKSGTTTFEGAATIDNSTIIVRAGATLILGATTINNQSSVTVEAGATLIINGNLDNFNNGTGTFTIAGFVQVNGNYSASVGNVDLTGSGDIYSTGTMTTTGSSDIFGSTTDCGSGPCSGRNLCSYSNTIAADQAICNSSTPATLTSSTTGSSPTYQWQSSTSSGFDNFTNIPGATSATYSSPSLTITRWFRLRIVSGGCTSFSLPVQVTVLLATGGWLGNTNDWNTASNWCNNAVPTSTTDVRISPFPSGSGKFMPVISTTANCRALTIDASVSVTISGANTLNISGSLTNNGTLADNSTSNIVFKGSSNQTIGGTAYNVFNSVTINNTTATQPAITLSGNNVNVKGTLTMTKGNINLAGFTLESGSSAASTGSLSVTSGWLYGGNITRWTGASSVSVGSGPDLLPIGTATDYRPIQVAHSAITNGGAVKVSHTGVTGSSAVAFSDANTTVAIQVVSNSYWGISTSGFASVSGSPFTLQTSGTGFGTVGALTDLRLVKATSSIGSSSAGTNTGSLTNPTVLRNSVALTDISSAQLYWGSINKTQTPLPIRLLSFDAKTSDGGILLLWETASEENFDHFEIQRAANNSEFETIISVPSKGGLNKKTEYTNMDQSPVKGVNYYRLKSIDSNGTYRYSPVKSVNWEYSGEIRLFPNPIHNKKFMVELEVLPNTYPYLKLYNQFGIECFSKEIVLNSTQIELPENISSGIYFVKVFSGIKQHVIKVAVK